MKLSILKINCFIRSMIRYLSSKILAAIVDVDGKILRAMCCVVEVN